MTDNIEKHVLEAARDAYAAQGDLRRRRMRYKRFTYGDQWGDIVRDSRGALVREGDLMAAGGRPPLTNNLIRRLVKTIVGRWRTMAVESRRYDAPALYARLNSLAELDARMLEEFLISGCAIQRVSRENRVPAGSAVWVDNVSPRDFFVNAFSGRQERIFRRVFHAELDPATSACQGEACSFYVVVTVVVVCNKLYHCMISFSGLNKWFTGPLPLPMLTSLPASMAEDR